MYFFYAVNLSLKVQFVPTERPDVWFWRGWRGSLVGQGSFFGPPVFNLDQLDIRGRVLHAQRARLFSSLCGKALAVLCSEEYPSRVFIHV